MFCKDGSYYEYDLNFEKKEIKEVSSANISALKSVME